MDSPMYCLFCSQSGHPCWNCPRYKSPYSKFYILHKNNGCFSCFKKGHPSFDCPEGRCEFCRGPHNSILCREIPATIRKTLHKKLDKMLQNGQIKSLEDHYDPRPKDPNEYQDDSEEEYI
ncbi:unnamed protein product [Bursaphelenchus xylophilus]|uniref:(pine wood nematode) hypothetical protein n=1 Tax=Bursaphelenchus xylophilus TaxID=6326 RepID=A0A1I7S2Q6_BURXY|nr:unnamed protein product [Bursaphelenchus xylophilus]CAG9121722.1 unnamed protein product [Bursaphelenchus xylophilus]